MKYYFLTDKKGELLKRHSMREYADFLEISVAYFCSILNRNRHTTKHLAYAISKYGGKSWEYYFEGVE